MLMDILGILLGFASIMLLFSLLVTSLGNLIQGACQLRLRQLQRGLRQVADHLDAANVLNNQSVKKAIGSLLDEKAVEGRLRREAAHIEADDIKSLISSHNFQRAPGEGASQQTQIVKDLHTRIDQIFPAVEIAMQIRFKRWMNGISIAIAFVVCVVFQVNSFDILTRLSAEPKFREQAITYGQQVIEAGPSVLETVDYNLAVNRAVIRLSSKNPDYAGQLEEISGAGVHGVDAAIDELKLVFTGQDKVYASLSSQYRDLLIDELSTDVNKVVGDVNQHLGQLALFNFEVLPNDWGYYWQDDGKATFNIWLGVVISSILISLGAPFWFNLLQNLFKLRESLTKVRAG